MTKPKGILSVPTKRRRRPDLGQRSHLDPDGSLTVIKRNKLAGLRGGVASYAKADTDRVAKAPGRNDPCACGSGKKTKRCCA